MRLSVAIALALMVCAAGCNQTYSNKMANEADRNNLKKIMIALHDFHDAHRAFPPAIVYGPDGKPWHSWRVLILPYLGEKELYNSYDLSKPWDSPENSKLLEKMPDIFRDPTVSKGKAKGATRYAGVTGDEASFVDRPDVVIKISNGKGELPQPQKGASMRSIRDFRDGTSLTVMIGRTRNPAGIPWMQPVDIPLANAAAGLNVSSGFEEGLFAFADGNTHMLKLPLDATSFRALLTHSGKEEVEQILDKADAEYRKSKSDE